MRAHLLRSKNSYKTVHNLDCYFISTFRKELAKRDKSIKTYLKTFQNKEGEWVYITKSLENSKNYHHKHQQQVNTRYKRMSKEQKDKYFKKILAYIFLRKVKRRGWKVTKNASLYRFFSVVGGLFAAMLKIICAKAKDVVILHSANSALSVDETN